jgi:EmrB/QacA subfamily drug resistance transporter
VLAATIVGSSLAFIDGTVVTVALPAIARELGATGADVQWVVEAYALFLSSLLLAGGSLGDRFGRRRVFALGIVIFTVASIACGLSRSTFSLILARGVQGIGGALLVPGSLALIAASFDSKARGKAIGTWSGFSGITTAIGPILGGWLVSLSWRWAFFLNVPLAAVVLLLLRRVPESRNPNARRLDLAGAFLATIGLGGLVYGLIESSRRTWADPFVIGAVVAGLIGLALFLLVEARVKAPMLPLGLFRSTTFAGANALTLFLYGALGCAFFFLPLDLIQVHGYSPLEAGAALLPFIVILFVLSRWSGGLVERFGERWPLVLGPIVAGVGFLALGLPGIGGSYWNTFFPGIFLLGLGMALSIAPLTTAVMNAVGQENAGIASGINNAVSRAAGLLAIAVLGLLLALTFDRDLAARLGGLPLPAAARTELMAERGKLAAAQPPPSLRPRDAAMARRAIDDAFVAGFRAVTRASAGLALLASFSSWLWIGREREGKGSAPLDSRRAPARAEGTTTRRRG